MRTALILLLSFLIISAFIITSPLPVRADASPDPVFDIAGDPVRAGQEYYIMSVFRPGGGLSLHRRGNEACRLDVVQLVFGEGLPVTFAPVNGTTKGDVVRVSTDLNFNFEVATACDISTVWKVDYCFDEALGQWFVTTGGVEGNPGPATTSNWFKIENVGYGTNDYKLVFCPSVCRFGKLVCRDVGLFHDDGGVRRLALTDVPFAVRFRKVSEAAEY